MINQPNRPHPDPKSLLSKLPPTKIYRIQQEMHLRQQWQSRFQRLSDRQIEILREVHGGLTSKEIAQKLFISQHTVRTHKQNIKRILDFDDRSKGIWFALAFDLI